MDTRSTLVTINQVIPALQQLAAVMSEAHDAEKLAAESIKKKDEAETAYKQAYSERAQIAEGIKNLKAQLAEEQQSYAKSSAEMIAKYAEIRDTAAQASKEALSKIAAEHHAQCVALAKKKSELQAEVAVLEKQISDHKQYIKAAQARLA
jgi:hypothetical protein